MVCVQKMCCPYVGINFNSFIHHLDVLNGELQ